MYHPVYLTSNAVCRRHRPLLNHLRSGIPFTLPFRDFSCLFGMKLILGIMISMETSSEIWIFQIILDVNDKTGADPGFPIGGGVDPPEGRQNKILPNLKKKTA